jgi:hypothetical protein
MQKKIPIEPELKSTLRTFDHISRKDYGLSFRAILKDTNKGRRSHRMRHLLGVQSDCLRAVGRSATQVEN